MTAENRIAGAPQIVCEVFLHLGGGFEGHRVQVGVELRQQAKAVAPDERGAFDALFVIRKTLFRGQTGQADIDDGHFGIAIWIGEQDFSDRGDFGIEEDDVNVVMFARSNRL